MIVMQEICFFVEYCRTQRKVTAFADAELAVGIHRG